MFLSGKSHDRLLELHEKYGPVVRLGPNELSYTDPKAWEDIMGRPRAAERQENIKAPWYAEPSRHNLIGARHEDHARMRRLLSVGFSASAMLEQQPLIKEYIDLLIQRLHENVENGKAVLDIHAWYNYCTFDIISDLSFGEPLGCLQGSVMHSWVSLIFANIKLLTFLCTCYRFPPYYILLPFFLSWKLVRDFNDHARLIKEKVAKRLALEHPRPDFMQSMMSSKSGQVGSASIVDRFQGFDTLRF